MPSMVDTSETNSQKISTREHFHNPTQTKRTHNIRAVTLWAVDCAQSCCYFAQKTISFRFDPFALSRPNLNSCHLSSMPEQKVVTTDKEHPSELLCYSRSLLRLCQIRAGWDLFAVNSAAMIFSVSVLSSISMIDTKLCCSSRVEDFTLVVIDNLPRGERRGNSSWRMIEVI